MPEVLRQQQLFAKVHTHALVFVLVFLTTVIWCTFPLVEAERLVRHTQLGMSVITNSSSGSCCTAPRLRQGKNQVNRLTARRFMSEKHGNATTSRHASMTAADLLESLKSEAAFAQQLQDPGFKFVVDSHLMLHDIVTKAVPLQAARTKGKYTSCMSAAAVLPPDAYSSTPGPTKTLPRSLSHAALWWSGNWPTGSNHCQLEQQLTKRASAVPCPCSV